VEGRNQNRLFINVPLVQIPVDTWLQICADTVVGDGMLRGISGGQKKRVTTSEMIVGPKKTLFLDEISTGLVRYLPAICLVISRQWSHTMTGVKGMLSASMAKLCWREERSGRGGDALLLGMISMCLADLNGLILTQMFTSWQASLQPNPCRLAQSK